MKSFETRIVRTWEPSKWLRGLGAFLLLVSAVTVYGWKPEITWVMTLGYIVYFITFCFALSFSFIKPKNLGVISISEDIIEVDYKGEKRPFLISDLKELKFDYRGYASFWKYTIYGNKNRLYFTDSLNERCDFEIILENKEKKEELKQFLKDFKSGSNLK